LACKTDAALYDLPLTLAVKVPADWKECEITQGRPRHTVVAKDGEVRFDAEPVSGEIVIGPAGSLE
jgi:hypothetical protein